jgi:hypothetical protein
LIAEGSDAQMQVTTIPLEHSTQWQYEIPPRGGFILRLDYVKKQNELVKLLHEL